MGHILCVHNRDAQVLLRTNITSPARFEAVAYIEKILNMGYRRHVGTHTSLYECYYRQGLSVHGMLRFRNGIRIYCISSYLGGSPISCTACSAFY